ncbi:hypothetical protein [Streptomyces luteireticuli]|uniref:hypothetical protein n=1 Tax=Streptomyces luteireticuli TaxID=173858 RepID=UPI0035571EA6
MTDYALAEERAARSTDTVRFLIAFHAGRTTSPTADTETPLREFLLDEDEVAVAGYLEGLAAAARTRMPEHPVNCRCQHCTHRTRYAQLQAARAAATAMRSSKEAVVDGHR